MRKNEQTFIRRVALYRFLQRKDEYIAINLMRLNAHAHKKVQSVGITTLINCFYFLNLIYNYQ